jgi:hypothetical protein
MSNSHGIVLGVGQGGLWFDLFVYVKSWKSMMGCWFSSLRLLNNIECAYCVAIMLICLNVLLIFFFFFLAQIENSTYS